jgi:hypothetical protein
MATIAGYSATPLPRKLGMREGSRILLLGAPADYAAQLQPLPPGVAFKDTVDAEIDIAQLFVMTRTELQPWLVRLRKDLRPDAVLWVSWPKKASKVPTDITEDTIRALALPLGWVDIKVRAVSEIWSGLKLVVRKALR